MPKSDHKYFNCSEDHEKNYVAGLYPTHRQQIIDFLEEKCADGTINNSTHDEVYALINQAFGLSPQRS